ncbi:Calcium uptake protein 1, mitochondrial [Branchiostoma belcheri]|nr:Calcium uptake protein 1, mitochondrial [Branchiostoma belcheri]
MHSRKTPVSSRYVCAHQEPQHRSKREDSHAAETILASRKLQAAEEGQKTGTGSEAKTDAEDEEPHGKKKRPTFKDRKVIEYENRIRQFSNPDKIFRYFATLSVISDGHAEIYMTPQDFLRSITPGEMQPEGLGLDQFMHIRKEDVGEVVSVKCSYPDIFSKLGNSGLINFTDYIFLLTVLTTPRRNFEVTFRVYDMDGDGHLSHDEFLKVENFAFRNTTTGMKHTERSVPRPNADVVPPEAVRLVLELALFDHYCSALFNVAATAVDKDGMGSSLAMYFFGPNLNQRLTLQKFLDFQEKVQDAVLKLEFDRCEPDHRSGLISIREFCYSLLMYSGLSDNKKKKMVARVKKHIEDEPNAPPGVSYDDFRNLFLALQHLHDIDIALTFFHAAGAPLDPTTLTHVAKTVAAVELADHIMQICFKLFDENDDGVLDDREFVSLLKQRATRGLTRHHDTGVSRMLSAIIRCTKQVYRETYSD